MNYAVYPINLIGRFSHTHRCCISKTCVMNAYCIIAYIYTYTIKILSGMLLEDAEQYKIRINKLAR